MLDTTPNYYHLEGNPIYIFFFVVVVWPFRYKFFLFWKLRLMM